MASFNDYLRMSLLQYPSLFATPLDAMVQVFAILGNGIYWHNGEMVGEEGEGVQKMNYSDLDEEQQRLNQREKQERDEAVEQGVLMEDTPARADAGSLNALNHKWQLKIDMERLRRQFVEKNIDAIVSTALVGYMDDDRYSIFTGYLRHAFADSELNAFSFPDDIHPDWAQALNKFLEYWEGALRKENGSSPKSTSEQSTWPQQDQELFEFIQTAKSRLYPILHNGESFEEGREKRRMVANKLIQALRSSLSDEPHKKAGPDI